MNYSHIFSDIDFFDLKKQVFNQLTNNSPTRNCDVVYRIIFNDGKSYIGQSINYFNNRLHYHLVLLRGGYVKYSGKKVNNAIREVGVKSIELLYVLDNDAKQAYANEHGYYLNRYKHINEFERFYINEFDAINNGYNSK